MDLVFSANEGFLQFFPGRGNFTFGAGSATLLGQMEELSMPPEFRTGGDVSVEVNFTINKGIRRCMAKYAFNFLALTCGPEFVLARDFDAIRAFIRHGHDAAYPLVVETLTPMLRDDSPLSPR